MGIMSYWAWILNKELVYTNEDLQLLEEIDKIYDIEFPTEEQKIINNHAYWFMCQFDVPSTDERREQYFKRLLSEAKRILK